MYSLVGILFLWLKIGISASYYPRLVAQNENKVEVVNYNDMPLGKCPEIKQPLCATNGKDFLYFENRCQYEVKNYELLIQGSMEYYECPLSYCGRCRSTCGPEYEPTCAVNAVTGEIKDFTNSCHLERRICTTRQDWHIVDPQECNSFKENIILSPLSGSSECPEYCTLEYKPICARFFTLEKEFSNECELKTTVCQTKQKWNVIRQGPCQSSKYKISPESSPIYVKLQNEDWQIVNEDPPYLGRHSDLNTRGSTCSQICHWKYGPVCAKFNTQIRHFSSNCELERTICETNQKWKIANFGPCSRDTKSFPSSGSTCPKFCTREYRPVCAKLRTRLREFENKCEFRKNACETGTNWRVLKNGRCPLASKSKSPCTSLCNKKFSPVCARRNGEQREFFNSCEYQKEACETNMDWELLNVGPCLDNRRKTLKNNCSNEVYDAICATFNMTTKTFNNTCQLVQEIQASGHLWSILYKGICESINPGNNTSLTKDVSITPKTGYADAAPAETINAYASIEKSLKTWQSAKGITTSSTATTAPQTTEHNATTQSISEKTYEKKEQNTEVNVTYTEFSSEENSTSNSETATPAASSTAAYSKTTTGDYGYSTEPSTEFTSEGSLEEVGENEKENCDEYDKENTVNEDINWSSRSSDKIKYTRTAWEETTASASSITTIPTTVPETYVNKYGPKTSNATSCSEDILKKVDNQYGQIAEPHNNETSRNEDGKSSFNKSKNNKLENTKYSKKCSHCASSTSSFEENLFEAIYDSWGDKYSAGISSYEVESSEHDANLYKHNDNKSNDNDSKMTAANSYTEASSKSDARDTKYPLMHNGSDQYKENENFVNISCRQEKTNCKNRNEQEIPLEIFSNNSQSADDFKKVNNNFKEEPSITNLLRSAKYLKAKALVRLIEEKIEFLLREDKNANSWEESSSEKSEVYRKKNIRSKPKRKHWNGNAKTKSIYNEEYNRNASPRNLKGFQTPPQLILSIDGNIKNKYNHSDEPSLLEHREFASINTTNSTHNIENNLKLYKAFVSKNKKEEIEDDENAFNQPLITSASETNSNYGVNKETGAQSQKYHLKNHYRTSKKGEVYNGAVYKGPVYDAPTYNFIYTAPHHGIIPFHYTGVNSAGPKENHNSQLLSAGNMFLGLTPLQSSLAAIREGFIKPSSTPLASNNTNNIPGSKQELNNTETTVKPDDTLQSKQKHLSFLTVLNNRFSFEGTNATTPKQPLGRNVNFASPGVQESKLSPFSNVPFPLTSAKPYVHLITNATVPTPSTNIANEQKTWYNSKLLKKILETLKDITSRP